MRLIRLGYIMLTTLWAYSGPLIIPLCIMVLVTYIFFWAQRRQDHNDHPIVYENVDEFVKQREADLKHESYFSSSPEADECSHLMNKANINDLEGTPSESGEPNCSAECVSTLLNGVTNCLDDSVESSHITQANGHVDLSYGIDTLPSPPRPFCNGETHGKPQSTTQCLDASLESKEMAEGREESNEAFLNDNEISSQTTDMDSIPQDQHNRISSSASCDSGVDLQASPEGEDEDDEVEDDEGPSSVIEAESEDDESEDDSYEDSSDEDVVMSYDFQPREDSSTLTTNLDDTGDESSAGDTTPQPETPCTPLRSCLKTPSAPPTPACDDDLNHGDCVASPTSPLNLSRQKVTFGEIRVTELDDLGSCAGCIQPAMDLLQAFEDAHDLKDEDDDETESDLSFLSSSPGELSPQIARTVMVDKPISS